MASPPASSTDGRHQRGERTRTRIVEAILELVREGAIRPTADEVAARAGVGSRTVFSHFDDMESLHAALNERIGQEVRPLLLVDAFSGSWDERLASLVDLRARIFERLAPARRAGLAVWPPSPVSEAGVRELNARLRGQLRIALGAELEALDPETFEALDAALSYESWHRLRIVQRLGRARAARAMQTAATALVAAAGRTGT